MAKNTKSATQANTAAKTTKNTRDAKTGAFVTVARAKKMEAGVFGYVESGRLTDAQARAAVRQVLGRR